jgi:hypothetical protein
MVLSCGVRLGQMFHTAGFTRSQVAGTALVASGAAVVAGGGSRSVSGVSCSYALLYVFAMLLPAITSIVKEKIFADARQQLDGRQLDVSIVNTFGSVAQVRRILSSMHMHTRNCALCTHSLSSNCASATRVTLQYIVLLFPVVLAQRNLSMADFPCYMASGWRVFTGAGADDLLLKFLPLLFICWNIAFNIAVLTAVRSVGAANIALVMTAAVPFTIWAFTFPLPLVGASPLPGKYFFPGTIILMIGMLLYHLKAIRLSWSAADQ